MKTNRNLTRQSLTSGIILIVGIFYASCNGGCGGKKDDQRESSHRRIEEIRKETGTPLEKIEKLGINLDARQRECSTRFADEKSTADRNRKAQECVNAAAPALISEAGVKPEHLKDIRTAHIFLQWELKYFLEERKTTEAQLKQLFRKAMAAAEQCDKTVTRQAGEDDASLARRREKCSDGELVRVCRDGGFEAADCGRIVSMGIDYGWEEKRVIRVANPGQGPREAHP